MRYVKVAFLGFTGGIVIGLVTGGSLTLLLSPPDSKDPSTKASLYAATISESLNCAALFSVIGAPAGVVIAALWRKR